jgi:hypothetical protein
MHWLGIDEGHHDISHELDSNTAAQEKLTKINRWFCEQLAYLAMRLAETPERSDQDLQAVSLGRDARDASNEGAPGIERYEHIGA